MESKRKNGKKRVRELDCNERAENGRISAGTKRRKSTKHDFRVRKSAKNNSAKVFKNFGHEIHGRVVTVSKVSFGDSGGDVCVRSSGSKSSDSRIPCLSGHGRNTYSSSSSRRQARKERSRLNRSLRSKSQLTKVSKEKDEVASPEWENVEDDSTISHVAGYGEVRKTERTGLGNPKRDGCDEDSSFRDASTTRKSRESESEVQIIMHGVYDREKRSEVAAKSNLCNNRGSWDSASSSSGVQPTRLSPGSVTSIVFSTIPSQPRIMAGPVACPVTPVLCHSSATGVPLVPVQSLNASTSAISSVSTPVVALPILPDLTPDMSGTLGHSGSTSTSLLQSILKPDMQAGYQVACDASVGEHSFPGVGSQNQVMADSTSSNFERNQTRPSVPSGECHNINSSGESDVECLELHNGKIPLISIEDDCETFVIEKDVGAVTVEESSDLGVLPCGEDTDKSDLDDGSGSVTTLKVDNWASYLLQRLEMLFAREEECDLVLKFSSGEILKAHRTIISACTSLLSQPHQSEVQQSEVAVPPELDYASVEPVLRFVYSGRLDVRGSKTQLSAIYIASQRLEVSLLTRLMDRQFPYLMPNKQSNLRQQGCKRTEKSSKFPKLKHGKSRSRGTSGMSTPSGSPCGRQKNKPSSKSDGAVGENGDVNSPRDEIHGTTAVEEEGGGGEEEEEGEESGQEGSVYFLVTNSQKIAQANAAVRRKRPAETARPTRFELEEETDNSSVQIATWSSKSAVVPFYPSGSGNQENGISVSTPGSDSTVCVTSPNNAQKNTNVTWSSTAVSSDHTSETGSRGIAGVQTDLQPQDPFSVLSHSVFENTSLSTCEQKLKSKLSSISCSTMDCADSDDVKGEETMDEEDAGKESEELMEKISNICKQLEDGDSDENETSGEEVCESSYKANSVGSEIPTTNDQSHLLQSNNESLSDDKDCIVLDAPDMPTKSILKKKKEKSIASKPRKRVSFPLDENNELINEVATYSNSKEPAQSLIDVQKTVGSFRSSEDSPSIVKLTSSLKKKVLMNLALDDADMGDSHSSHENERGKSKKGSVFSGQSTSQGISQGDMSNHAKIISEVLKKYPHLVKDRKNIRLKILKKGNEKSTSGKLVKSKVQYLVLSENDHKAKQSGRHDKNSSSGNKADASPSSRSAQSVHKFECPECDDVTFPSYFTFKKHVTTEHKEKSSSILASIENVPYACYTCFLNEPLEFADYCSYQQHMKEVHSKREARLCSMCGYRPGRKLELAYHQYIEHNKIPRNVTFPKCDLCDHVAMNDAALLKHRSQHANADNYTCSVCGVAFRSFGALQGHMQTKLCQSKPSVSHKCPYCPQTFARSYNLKAHCKSVHRAAHIAAQAASSSASKSKQPEPAAKSVPPVKKLEEAAAAAESGSGGSDLTVENVCESLSGMANNQSSSEAEALSTVANSLAASLGLPEETVNQYMYTQGDLEGDKYEETAARSSDVNAHLVESTAASVSGYSGNLPLCHEGTYTSQSPTSTTTAVGTFYPVGVMPSQLVPGQIVSGEFLQSQVLPGTCVNVAGSTMLGAPPHSWTYVTYQVPTSGEDLPSVMADPSNIPNLSTDQSTTGGVDMPSSGKSSKNEGVNNGSSGVSDSSSSSQSNVREPSPLVVMTNTATQVSISHASHISTPQSYDAFSSQFV